MFGHVVRIIGILFLVSSVGFLALKAFNQDQDFKKNFFAKLSDMLQSKMVKMVQNGQFQKQVQLDYEQQKKYFLQQQSARRKHLSSVSKYVHLHSLVVAEVHCPTMVRVGLVTDGGKWVCNPWRLPMPCIIYSMGKF